MEYPYTLTLINNELIKIDDFLNKIYSYPRKLDSTKEQILKDTLQRRDDLLFERDAILKINNK